LHQQWNECFSFCDSNILILCIPIWDQVSYQKYAEKHYIHYTTANFQYQLWQKRGTQLKSEIIFQSFTGIEIMFYHPRSTKDALILD